MYQYIIVILTLYLSEYGANLVNKEGEPSRYSPPSTQFTRLIYEYLAKVVIISDSAIGEILQSLSRGSSRARHSGGRGQPSTRGPFGSRSAHRHLLSLPP